MAKYRNDNCKHKASIRAEILGMLSERYDRDDFLCTLTLPALNFALEEQIAKNFRNVELFLSEVNTDVLTKQKNLLNNCRFSNISKCRSVTLLNNDIFEVMDHLNTNRLGLDLLWLDLCSMLTIGLINRLLNLDSYSNLYGNVNNKIVLAITLQGAREQVETQKHLIQICGLHYITENNLRICRQRLFPKLIANGFRSKGFKVSVIIRNYIPQSREVRKGPYMYTYIYNIQKEVK